MTARSIDWPALLLDYRKSRGLKQAAAAQDFGVSQATISRWERGACRPSVAVQNVLFRIARRERSPLETLRWAETFRRMLVPGLVTSPDRVIAVVTAPLAAGLGVPAAALEGLTIEEAFEGDCVESGKRLVEEGFFSGRIASYEAIHRVTLNRRIRRNSSLFVHYVGWPHFVGERRIATVGQGVVVSPAEAAEIRSRLGGVLRITRME